MLAASATRDMHDAAIRLAISGAWRLLVTLRLSAIQSRFHARAAPSVGSARTDVPPMYNAPQASEVTKMFGDWGELQGRPSWTAPYQPSAAQIQPNQRWMANDFKRDRKTEWRP